MQAVSCASGGALGYARARAHTPLRHPHVTSTTHPHHLHGMSEMNLRGLLNASGARRAPHAPHAPHAPLQHAYHQSERRPYCILYVQIYVLQISCAFKNGIIATALFIATTVT